MFNLFLNFCGKIYFMTAKTAIQEKAKIKLFTYEDYVAMTPPDSGNYELHEGKIVFMPSPTTQHQDVSMKLSAMLYFHIVKYGLGKVFAAPVDTVFDKHNTLQPDILFISKERSSIIEAKRVNGAPDFIIEIESPSNTKKVLSFKKYIYETFGVKEYWVVHLDKNTIGRYENLEEELVLVGTFGIGDVIQSSQVEGFELSVNELFSL